MNRIDKERALEAARVRLCEARDMVAKAARSVADIFPISTQVGIADDSLALALCGIIETQDGIKSEATKGEAYFLEVLRNCKAMEGRTYKSKILMAWQTGNYGALKGWECELQQIRNKLGCAWLEGVRV